MKPEESINKIDATEFREILGELGLTEENLSSKIALQTLNKRWVDIIGPIYAKQSEPFSLQGDTLVVITSHAAYKQEILFLKKRIFSYAYRYLGKDVLKKIDVRVGNLSRKDGKSDKITAPKTGLEGKQDLISLAEKETDPIAKKRLLELIEYL